MKYTALLCAMAAIGLAACTQDELTDGTLPEGKYPLVINATGLQTATLDTRATVDGNWDGVNSVAVQVGDEVKKGQTIIILEAMKMENNINADRDGKVTAINVSKGDSILEGTDLVIIE